MTKETSILDVGMDQIQMILRQVSTVQIKESLVPSGMTSGIDLIKPPFLLRYPKDAEFTVSIQDNHWDDMPQLEKKFKTVQEAINYADELWKNVAQPSEIYTEPRKVGTIHVTMDTNDKRYKSIKLGFTYMVYALTIGSFGRCAP